MPPRNRLAAVVALLLVVSCHREEDGLQRGVAPGLAPELVPVAGATNIRSGVGAGGERVTYTLSRPYPARDVILSISNELARRGYRPYRNNWFNRDETSDFVRGWDQSLVVFKVGGRKQFMCRWWAQWGNDRGELVDYSLGYLSPSEGFTNTSEVNVAAMKLDPKTAAAFPVQSAGRPAVFLSAGTPPNATTAVPFPVPGNTRNP